MSRKLRGACLPGNFFIVFSVEHGVRCIFWRLSGSCLLCASWVSVTAFWPGMLRVLIPAELPETVHVTEFLNGRAVHVVASGMRTPEQTDIRHEREARVYSHGDDSGHVESGWTASTE